LWRTPVARQRNNPAETRNAIAKLSNTPASSGKAITKYGNAPAVYGNAFAINSKTSTRARNHLISTVLPNSSEKH
jgi:hypothetical protein